MKPYQQISIRECGEPLVPIPTELAVIDPHPYQRLGAPYDNCSPFWLRKTVTEALLQAQYQLQRAQPGWQLQIFDAYRPLAVQQFMVDYTAQALAQQQGLTLAALTVAERAALLEKVYQFWALPSPDPRTPPPHSTGAAVDVTLIDGNGQPVDMGSPIDEVSERSHPDYFHPFSDRNSQRIHRHRRQLNQALAAAGFKRHPNEWWHFSQGDQLWAWLVTQETGQPHTASYGCIEPPDQ